MKNILTFIFLGLAVIVNSQTKLTAASMYDSLNARVYRIECALYDGVMSGKIKPYKNDSLTSVYSLEAIKYLSTVNRSVQNSWNVTNEPDSIYETSLNPHVQGYGLLTVLKPTKIDLNSIEDNYTFSSVAVLFQPNVGNTEIKLPIQSWFYIRYSELATVLSSKEIIFLTQLSKMLSTDKYFGLAGTRDSVMLSTLLSSYYAPGVYNGFTRTAALNYFNLNALAKNCFDYSVLLIHDELIKTYSRLGKDSAAKNSNTFKLLKATLTYPFHVNIYPDPKDPTNKIDSVIDAGVGAESFKKIVWDAQSIGISKNTSLRNEDKDAIITLSRNDFLRIAPAWLPVFLWYNF